MQMDKRFKKHDVLFIDWHDINKVMQELTEDKSCEVNILDFSYIQAYSSMYNKDYTDTEIIRQLSEYLNVKFSHYNSDERGVWFVVKKA